MAPNLYNGLFMPKGVIIYALVRRHGMRMGFAMRQQAIAAVFAKALRLNSSSIADISAGKVTRPACPAMGIQAPSTCSSRLA